MKRIRLAYFIALVLCLVAARQSFAADVLGDFCASPQAKADKEAVAQCAEYSKALADSTSKKTEKDAAQAAIDSINAEIRLTEQKIKLQNTIISKLSGDITSKTKVVASLQSQIDRQSKSIADIVKMVNVHDATSMPSVFLGSESLSDFYVEVDTLATINKQLLQLVGDVKDTKQETESEREALQDRKDRESDAKAAIEADKRLIERKKAERAAILALKTTEYNSSQKLLDAQKQKIAQIRSRLFKFQDGEGIPFGDAYDYAVEASQATAVRPAFVLGILMQESSYDSADSAFGKQVGSCLVKNDQTGEGVGANTGTAKMRVMNPTRDIPPFKNIASDLGLDWQNQRVSCWIAMHSKGVPYGWGGAMGPAQFIPSTWMLYQKRIAKAFGISASQANPWNPEHAIMAASLYLSDLGAGLQTYSAEKNAACRYYSGKSCASSSDGNTYGVSVMKWVAKVQEEMIDPLLGK